MIATGDPGPTHGAATAMGGARRSREFRPGADIRLHGQAHSKPSGPERHIPRGMNICPVM